MKLFTAILSGVQGDTRRYRSFHLYEQFCLAGIPCIYDHIILKTAVTSVAKATILILQRVTWDRNVARIVNEAHSRGVIILADLDDLIFLQDSFQWIDSPDFSDPIRAKLYKDNIERNRITLEHCDGFIVSTSFLAEQMNSFGKPVWVHRNAFSLEMLTRSQKALQSQRINNDKIIIGYASGTPTHDRDFQPIQLVLKQLLEEYPSVYLYLIGHVNRKLNWGKASPKVHYFNFVPWRELPHLLAHFAINLAPLRLDNPFSQSKSEIKYLEAALVKVPTIASPTEAFRHAIRNGENGLLANTPEEWESCLRTLIENPDLRKTMADAAYSDVFARYSPWKRAEEAIQLLNAGIQTFCPDWQNFSQRQLTPILNPHTYQHLWIKPEVEKHPTLLERGFYTLRARGIGTLLKDIWIFLRRTLSPLFPFRNQIG